MSLSDYYFQRGLRKIIQTPPEVKAIPNVEAAVAEYVAGKTAKSARAGAKTASRNLRKSKLAEIVRQSEASRGLKSSKLAESVRQSEASRGLKSSKLAESVRQSKALRDLGYEALDLEREKREAMKSLGRKATNVGLMNIGATVVGGWYSAAQQEKMHKELIKMQERHNQDMLNIFSKKYEYWDW